MKKLYLLPSAVALALGLTICQGAEPTRHNTMGYKPAQDIIHETLVTSKKMALPHLKSTFAAAPDRARIAELANISNWPDALVYDQGQFGTCTANSAAFATCYLSIANSKKPTTLLNNPEALRLSRWYQYYNTRYHEAKLNNQTFNPGDDTGTSIAGSVLALDIYGCCPESTNTQEETIQTPDLKGTITYKGWPYTPNLLSVQPEPLNYVAALDRSIDGLNSGTPYTKANKDINPYAMVSQALQYRDLATPYRKSNYKVENTQAEKDAFINAVITSLKSNHPIMAGVMLDDSFMKDKKGYIPTPNLNSFRATGGHAIPIVGYGPYNKSKPTKCYFKFLNSWSPQWGDHGFGYFEENYFANVNIFQIEAYEVWFNPAIK